MADFEAAAQEIQEARGQNDEARVQQAALKVSLDEAMGLIEEAKKLASLKSETDELKKKAWASHIITAAAAVHIKGADETQRYDESTESISLLETASDTSQQQVGLLREFERVLTEAVANIERLQELVQQTQASLEESTEASNAAEQKMEELADRI